jgi:hypothetical protein
MKVNSAGIQSYQSLIRRDQAQANAAEARATQQTVQKTVIEPQSSLQKSAIAVQVPKGTYAQYLSESEKQALNLLFEKFNASGRFGAALQSGEGADEQTLGRLVDVKV